MAALVEEVIQATPERVFSYLSEEDKVRLWMDDLVEMTFERREGEARAGDRFRQKIREGVRIAEYEGEIIAFDRPSYLALSITSPQFALDITYRLVPNGAVTHVQYSIDVRTFNLLSKLLAKLFRSFLLKLAHKQMKKLKTVVEQSE